MTGGDNGYASNLTFVRPPTRVVSLVPSMTQSLLDLDCGQFLVGVTEYCPHIEDEPIAEVVGGTHQIDLKTVTSLNPDLVLANQEENDREDVEALERAGLKVWVTFPKTVQSAVQILWALAKIFNVMKTASPKILLIERSLNWVQRGMSEIVPKSVFVPIWQDQQKDAGPYWMTFNKETYCDSVLKTCGAYNVFRERHRRYPLEAEFNPDLEVDPGDRDIRYPRVGVDEIIERAPELILLPSEPFEFTDQDRQLILELLIETPAVKNGMVIPVDGRWLSWHGTMLAKAIASLPELLS
jgi:ABC-type Fe3+-hydroxamate transport system substrate-binding protein